MEELIETNKLNWNGYETIFLTEKQLKEFLMSEAIPSLSARFKEPSEFYEKILFQIPEAKEHKKFKMIYSHLVEYYPHNYLEKKELAEKHSIQEKNIIAEGSVKLMDTSKENPPLVRWLIVKN